MATEQVLVEINAKDSASPVLEDAAGNTEKFGDQVKSSFSGAEDASKNFAFALAAAGAAAVALGAVSLKAFYGAETASKQLEHAVVNVSKGTQEQLRQTEALADALERKGVLDADNIKTGLAQLSTFGLSNDAVRGLGGALADLSVNQFGVSASGEQMTQSANMIAKVLKGQFGVLEKSGIRFTELQQKVIMTGTEMEKVQAVTEGLAQNLKFTNEIAIQTGEGLTAHILVALGKFPEAIGILLDSGLRPLLVAFSTWIHRLGTADEIALKLKSTFEAIQPYFPLIAGAITGMLVPAFLAWATAIWAAMTPLVPFAIAGAAVAAVAYLIYQAWSTNFLGFQDVVLSVIETLAPYIQMFMDTWSLFKINLVSWITEIKWAWQTNLFGIRDIATTIFNYLKTYISGAFEVIKGIFKVALALVTLDWKLAWEGIGNIAKGVWDMLLANFSLLWSGIKGIYSIGISALSGAWSGVMDGMSLLASKVWEGIKETFKAGINAIMRYINGFIDTYNFAVSKVPGGKNLKLPTFTPFADGGIVTKPTLALIGEAGPEAVVPLSGPRAGGIGGVTVVIQGNNFYGDDETFAERVGNSIVEKLSLNMTFPRY